MTLRLTKNRDRHATLAGVAALLVLAGLTGGITVRAAGVPKDAEAIQHALNRLAYGPRPGDLERVQQLGLSKWIEQQLHPDAIDDTALQARLPQQPPRPTALDDAMAARRWGRQSVQALSAEKVIRAVYSERQLEEQLVDFWFNHFNVFAGKGRTSLWVAEYERTAIRPYVFGKFRDMLEATAKSPAMLFYLDNWQSSAAMDARTQGKKRPSADRINVSRTGGSSAKMAGRSAICAKNMPPTQITAARL